jgi:hypothetical protein
MSDLTRYEDDDGFSRTLRADNRLLKGIHARWTDSAEWHDRDNLPIPSPLLVVGATTALQSWKDRVPTVITDKPLPDPDELNATIPQSEWEIGLDGKPRPPWQTVHAVYMVHEASGVTYTALNSTSGWRIAFEALSEAVTVKRMLHGGVRMLPIVSLETRPFKTNFGIRKRPHLQIVGWRSAGDRSGPPIPAPTSAPQLPPGQASTPAQAAQAAPAQAAPETAPAHPAAAAANLTEPPKPVTMAEFVADEIPWK